MRMSLACTCLSMSSVTLPEPVGTHYLALIPPGLSLMPSGTGPQRAGMPAGVCLGLVAQQAQRELGRVSALGPPSHFSSPEAFLHFQVPLPAGR